jgi:hypothetical protein
MRKLRELRKETRKGDTSFRRERQRNISVIQVKKDNGDQRSS